MRVGTRIGIALCSARPPSQRSQCAPAGAGAAPKASVAKSSSLQLSANEQRHLGASYVYSLKVTNLELRQGEEPRQGLPRVPPLQRRARRHLQRRQGLQLQREKLDASTQLLSAKATCKKGSKKFKQTFGENT